jgi:hypothetical protein
MLGYIVSTKYSAPELGYTVIATDSAPDAVVDRKHGVLCSYSGAHNEHNQRKEIYIEHRAGKTAHLASWRKMTQPGEFCW